MTSSPIRSNVLRRRLLVLLGAIFVLGLAIMAIDNMVQFDATATELSGYWLVQMLLLGVFAFIAPGYFASVWALRPLFRWMDDAGSDREATVAAARRATLRYPWLALAFFAGFGIFGSGLFHVTSALHEFGSLVTTDPNWWPATAVVFANEFSIAVALGIAFFAGARRLLRPFLAILPPSASRDGHARSLRLRILVITLALSLSTGVPILTLEFYGRYGLPVSGNEALVMLAQGLLLTVVIGAMSGNDLAADLQLVTGELRILASSRRPWSKTLAVTSDDETADLVLAYNAVRAQAEAVDRELERELETARRVQAELLPKGTFSRAGWQLAGLSLAARTIGGDFFDVFDLGGERFGVAIGDAAGKGVPAALLMATAMSFLRAEAPRAVSPAKLLSSLSDLLGRTIPVGSFVTMLYVVVDPATMTCTISSAGHVDPLRIGRGGADCSYLEFASLPLGITSGQEYRDLTLRLEPGEKLLFYSDGLPEARNGASKFYGFERLTTAAARIAHDDGGAELAAALCAEVRAFAGDSLEPDDDLTVVVIEAPDGDIGTPAERI